MPAAYVLFAAILFFAFVAANFPYADTISAIVTPMKLKVVFPAQRMSFPIGARLQDVQVISTATQPEQLLLQSPEVTIAPSLALLLLGRPSIRIRAQIYGGVLRATLRQRASVTGINFELDSLGLAPIELGHELGASLSGAVSGRGSAEINGVDLMADTASVILNARDIALAVVDGFPPLRFGRVNGRISLNQGIVNLQNIHTHGADVDIEAGGELQLGPDLADTTIELTVRLVPTTAGRKRFGVLLGMLPHPPSEGPYHVEGLITSPSVS